MADDPTQSQRNAGDDDAPDDSERNAPASPNDGGQRNAGVQRNAADADDSPTDEPLRDPGLRALEEMKREKRRLERELADARAKVKEHEDASKSELEKVIEERNALKTERETWQQCTRTQNLRHQTADAAREAGFADPADVYRFLDLDALEFDDDDQPLGIADQVKTLAKAKPYLLAPKNGANGPPATEKSSRPGGQVSPEEDKQRRQEFERNFAQSW